MEKNRKITVAGKAATLTPGRRVVMVSELITLPFHGEITCFQQTQKSLYHLKEL